MLKFNTTWQAVFPGKPWERSSSLSISSGWGGWGGGGGGGRRVRAGWLDASRRGGLHAAAAAARGPGACAHFCFQPSRGADVPIQTTAGRRGRQPRATATTARDTAPHRTAHIPLLPLRLGLSVPSARARRAAPSDSQPVPVCRCHDGPHDLRPRLAASPLTTRRRNNKQTNKQHARGYSVRAEIGKQLFYKSKVRCLINYLL